MRYAGPTELYFDGEWTSVDSGATIETVDPKTEEVYAMIARAETEDGDAAVDEHTQVKNVNLNIDR